MATDEEFELQRELRNSQTQYVYFLLFAAGAAIALVVNQTHDRGISLTQIPLAAAVLCWGLSFYFGCRNRTSVNSGLSTRATITEAKADQDLAIGADPQPVAVGVDTLQATLKSQSAQATRFYVLQFRFLVSGAILYVVWHVFEMYMRSL